MAHEVNRLNRVLGCRLLVRVVGFELFGYIAVQFTNDLVDGLLPRGITVFTQGNGHVELSQRHLRHLKKPLGDLLTNTG